MLTAKVRSISVLRGVRRLTTESSGRKQRVRPNFPDKNGNSLGASYPGSKNYKPGKQGYAPGFPPPKNWSAEPRENLPPMESKDLPEASLKQTYVPKRPTAAKDAQRLYNQKMREMRYEYQHDNLIKKEKRQKEVAMKWEKLQIIQREKCEQLVKQRVEYEINVKEDPLSAENVLNAEGKTLLSNVTDSPPASYEPKRIRHKTIGYTLAPPRVTVLVPKEENEIRAVERQRNREEFIQRQHEDHIQMLMTLFHEADGFVHYGNIDQKISNFLSSVAVPHRSLSEMIDSLHRSGGVVTTAEISRRTEELRNELQGTTGRYAGLGYDGLTQWLDDHPDDKDGIKQVQLAEHIDSVMPHSQE